MTDGPETPQLRALAEFAAKYQHCRFKAGTFRAKNEGHFGDFITCPHPNCVLVRAGAAPQVSIVTVSPTDLLPVGEALERLRAQASRTMAGSGKQSAAYSLAAFVIEQVEQIETAVSDQIEAANTEAVRAAAKEPAQ